MDIQIYYAGENSQRVYEPIVPAIVATFNRVNNHGKNWQWDKGNNTLRVLLVTPRDIDPREQYTKIDWSVMQGCTVTPSRASVDASQYLSTMTQKLYRLLATASDNGFLKDTGFREATWENPFEVADNLRDIASGVMAQTESAYNMSLYLNGMKAPVMIVSLADKHPDINETIKGFSGLDAKYFINLRASPLSHNIFTMGHEIIGHGVAGHYNDPKGPRRYNCTDVDYDVTDTDNMQEGEADIAGTLAHDAAREMGIVKDDSNIANEIEAMRAIGNIFMGKNRFSIQNGNDINNHVTTLLFDPTKQGYRSEFNLHTSARGASAVLPIIVTFADMLSGYVFAREVENNIKRNGKNFTQADRDAFRGVIKSPLDNVMAFADLGQKTRFGYPAENGLSAIAQSPHLTVAAIKYLQQSGGLDAIKARLVPALRPVVDDIVDDFLSATKNYGSALLNAPALAKFTQYLPKKIDYNVVVAEVMLPITTVQNRNGAITYMAEDSGITPLPPYILQGYKVR